MNTTVAEIIAAKRSASGDSGSPQTNPAEPLVALWRETYSTTLKKSEEAVLRFVFVAFLFVLINATQIKKANLFGIELDNLQIISVLTYVLAAIFLYQFIGLYFFGQIIEEVLRIVGKDQFGAWHDGALAEMTKYPSLPNMEYMWVQLLGMESRAGRTVFYWSVAVVVFVTLAVIGWFCWASWTLLTTTVIGRPYSISAVCFGVFLLMRSVFVFVHFAKTL